MHSFPQNKQLNWFLQQISFGGNQPGNFVLFGMSLAMRLVTCRKAKNISQLALAELVGCSQQSIHAIEEGRSLLPRKIKQIAAVLETTPDYLLYGTLARPDPFLGLAPEIRDLIIVASQKLASPGLDSDVRNTAIGALRLVAKQNIPIYRGDPPNTAVIVSAEKKSATG